MRECTPRAARSCAVMFQRVIRPVPAHRLTSAALIQRARPGCAMGAGAVAGAPVVDIFAPSIGELLFISDRPRHTHSWRPALSCPRWLTVKGLPSSATSCSAWAALSRRSSSAIRALPTDRARHRSNQRILRSNRARGRCWLGREVLAPCFAARSVAGTTGSGDCTIGGCPRRCCAGGSGGAATSAAAVGACSVEVWIRQRNPAVAGRRRTDRTRLARLHVDIDLGHE